MAFVTQNNSMNFAENNHASAVLDRLRLQRDNRRFCDIVLRVQGIEVPVNKNVLAACSPYFDSILERFEDDVMDVDCESHDAFMMVLNYMYTGNVVIDKNNVIEILKLANQFLVAKLKSYCAEYLERYLDINNCLLICDLASSSKYNMTSLYQSSVQLLQLNIDKVLEQIDVFKMSSHRVEWLLNGEAIGIPNFQKLKFVIDWTYHDIKERENYFRNMLGFVNFEDVDKCFLIDLLQNNLLFKDSHKCALEMHDTLREKGFDLADVTFDWVNKSSKSLENILYECNHGDNLLTVAMAAAITEDTEILKETSAGTEDRSSNSFGSLDEDNESSLKQLVEEGFMMDCNEFSSSDGEISDDKLFDELFSFKKKNLPIKMRITRSVKEQKSVALRNKLLRRHALSRKVFSESVSNINAADIPSVTWKPPSKGDSPSPSSEEENRDEAFNSDDSLFQQMIKSPSSLIDAGLVQLSAESDDVLQCTLCTFMTSVASRIEQHIAKAHGKNVTYTCSICQYTAQWNKDYYNHMKIHFPGPPYKCDICDYTCDRIQPVLAHRMKHTDEKPFQCSQCVYKCRTKNNLIAHIRSHTGERPFRCEHCGRCFAIKSTLDQHLVTHSDNRPYLCDACGFSTKYQSHLIAHKRIHTGDVYSCQYPHCTYFSPKKSQLKAHMRTHMAIRSHICRTCGRGFVEKSHLVRHERIHLDDKPFKCDLCDYGSSRRDKLKEHKIKHHHINMDIGLSKPKARGRKTNKQVVAEQMSKSMDAASLNGISNGLKMEHVIQPMHPVSVSPTIVNVGVRPLVVQPASQSNIQHTVDELYSSDVIHKGDLCVTADSEQKLLKQFLAPISIDSSVLSARKLENSSVSSSSLLTSTLVNSEAICASLQKTSKSLLQLESIINSPIMGTQVIASSHDGLLASQTQALSYSAAPSVTVGGCVAVI